MNNNNAIEILKEFSEQLKTQEYDGNTERLPTYWAVQKREKIYHIDPYEADIVLMGFSDEPKLPVEDFKKVLANKIRENLNNLNEAADYCDELNGLTDFDDIKSFCEDIKGYYAFGYDWDVEVVGCNIEWRDIQNEMFLTKKDAKRYIKKFGYRYNDDEKPLRTYAYVAGNSPDLKRLIDALKCIDWEQIGLDDAKVPDKTSDETDMQEVKHGMWQSDNEIIYYCSECKSIAFPSDYEQYLSNYCPYCGARMDGEENE